MTYSPPRSAARLQLAKRRLNAFLAAVVALIAFGAWTVVHEDHPQEVLGTWVWESNPGGEHWGRTDTIALWANGHASRRAHSRWQGTQPVLEGRPSLDTLDLSGAYTWGVASTLSGPRKLCLRYVGEAPPFGCFPLQVGKGTMTLGTAVFLRIADAE